MKGAIEIEKIVKWVLALLVLAAILALIFGQIAPGNPDGFANKTLETLFDGP